MIEASPSTAGSKTGAFKAKSLKQKEPECIHFTSSSARGSCPIRLQTLEPVTGPNGPGLKNEMVLPAVLDPWAASALYEAANLAAKNPGSKVWLVSLGPKAKLQQVMMTIAQKAPFELVPSTGPSADSPTRTRPQPFWPRPSPPSPGSTGSELLLFGGWESATRGAGVTLQMIGERLGITDQFQGVDQIDLRDDGSFEVLERVEGGKHQVSVCAGAPAVLGWATGNLARAAQQSADRHGQHAHPDARAAKGQGRGAQRQRTALRSVSLPKQQRTTRVVKDMSPDEIAAELAAWMWSTSTDASVRWCATFRCNQQDRTQQRFQLEARIARNHGIDSRTHACG